METTVQSAATSVHMPSLAAELRALLTGAAVAPLEETGWIKVTGDDRVRWLNGMVTNSIQQLKPGEGCYNFVLNAQGRIQGDLTAWMLEDSILLQSGRQQLPALLAHLDHFIIMDDVELTDISDQRKGILIAGPDALRTVQQLGGTPCSTPALGAQLSGDLTLKQTAYLSSPVLLIHAYSPLVPRFEIWGDSETMAKIDSELANSVPKATAEALDQLRILSGTPRYGTDIRDRDLPQETGQTRALHFSKGCYLGQEIVERIRSRGNVHRTFSGFELDGILPSAASILEADGKPVGELTSVASIQLPGTPNPRSLARGDVRREAVDRGLALQFPGGTATPISLPYAIS
jgi:folate-binding protein YgfZ